MNGERERRLDELNEYAGALRGIISRADAKARVLVSAFGDTTDESELRAIGRQVGQAQEARSMLRGIAAKIRELMDGQQ